MVRTECTGLQLYVCISSTIFVILTLVSYSQRHLLGSSRASDVWFAWNILHRPNLAGHWRLLPHPALHCCELFPAVYRL